LRNVVAVVLGGGKGERLMPLTRGRAKPAVPFAGTYRLVDIPISNCLHAGIDRIFVLTQYRSVSLNRHVANTYRFDAFSSGSVTVLAAELSEDEGANGWYRGTADAVRKHMGRYASDLDEDVIILSGDQVYGMRLDDLVLRHRDMDADVTVATLPVPRSECHRFGLMRVDEDGWIKAFAEKPKDDETLDAFRLPHSEGDNTHLASMGIYVFKAEVLQGLLGRDSREDFGKHIIPTAIDRRKVLAFPFEGFWEDVGTIQSYHEVHMRLTDPVPPFNLFVEESPIFTRPRFLPPSKVGQAHIERAILSGGCIIGDGSSVRNSVLGIRANIGTGCSLEDVVCNGAGGYDFDAPVDGFPRRGIGPGSVLHRVILDRDARVGSGVKLVNEKGVRDYQDQRIYVRDGIIVVPRWTVIPDGYCF